MNEGPQYRVEGATARLSEWGLPPLFFGGASPAAEQVAAEHVDVYLAWGETPPQIIREVLDYSAKAVASIDAAAPLVTKNADEFARLRNDIHCIRAMSQNYAAKANAAIRMLHFKHSNDRGDIAMGMTYGSPASWAGTFLRDPTAELGAKPDPDVRAALLRGRPSAGRANAGCIAEHSAVTRSSDAIPTLVESLASVPTRHPPSRQGRSTARASL